VGLIFLRFFKFICEKSCPRLDIGRLAGRLGQMDETRQVHHTKPKTSIAADAQAEANRKLAESLSDTLIDYQKIQKWDGKLPTVSGGNALVSIDPAE